MTESNYRFWLSRGVGGVRSKKKVTPGGESAQVLSGGKKIRVLLAHAMAVQPRETETGEATEENSRQNSTA